MDWPIWAVSGVLQCGAGPSPSPRWPCFIKSSSGPRSFNVIIIGRHVPPPSKHCTQLQLMLNYIQGLTLKMLKNCNLYSCSMPTHSSVFRKLQNSCNFQKPNIKFSFSQIQIICDTGIRTNLLSSKSRPNPLKCRKISL